MRLGVGERQGGAPGAAEQQPAFDPQVAAQHLDIADQVGRGVVLEAAERAGAAIDLSPREAAILELLHEMAGQVVDRDTLLNRCWGMDYFPESRTLDQHIAKLRKRIELDPVNPVIIETVRGVGYRYRNG